MKGYFDSLTYRFAQKYSYQYSLQEQSMNRCKEFAVQPFQSPQPTYWSFEVRRLYRIDQEGDLFQKI